MIYSNRPISTIRHFADFINEVFYMEKIDTSSDIVSSTKAVLYNWKSLMYSDQTYEVTDEFYESFLKGVHSYDTSECNPDDVHAINDTIVSALSNDLLDTLSMVLTGVDSLIANELKVLGGTRFMNCVAEAIGYTFAEAVVLHLHGITDTRPLLRLEGILPDLYF